MGAYRFFKHVLQAIHHSAEATHAQGSEVPSVAALAGSASAPFDDASGRRILIKCPEHLWSLDALLATFPDAQVIWSHREPISAISSYCTQAAALVRINQGSVDTKRLVPAVSRCLLDGVDRGLAASQSHPDRICDVSFAALCADPAAETRRLKAWLGLPHDKQSEEQLIDFLKGGSLAAADKVDALSTEQVDATPKPPSPSYAQHTRHVNSFELEADVASKIKSYMAAKGCYM